MASNGFHSRSSRSHGMRSLFSVFSSDLAIDLGTANTLVYAKGKGVVVNEPSVPETVQILIGVIPRYEAHHRLRYSPQALEAAASMAAKYVSDRFLPEASYPVEIGQQIKCLRHHAHGQKRRHVQQVPGHRALSKILHWRESSLVAVRLRRMSVANCRGRLVARNFFSIEIIPTQISVAGELEEELRQRTAFASLRDEESRRSTR